MYAYMKNKILLLLPALIMPFTAHSGNNSFKSMGTDIRITAPQLKNEDVFLGQYFMGKLYSKDTIRIDRKGNGRLQSQEKLPEGMYVVYFDSTRFFDLLIGSEQDFSVKIDTADIPQSIEIKGSGETADFFQYTLGLIEKQKRAAEYNQRIKQGNDSNDIAAAKAELDLLNEAFKADKSALESKYPESMTSLFLNGLQIPEFEPANNYDNLPAGKKDSLSIMDRYMFYSRHYLDNFDFSDERTFRTPYCINTINRYLNDILVQSYDSIIPHAIDLVERSRGSEECFRYMCSHILDYAVKSNIMGMDSLLVALADRYYLNGVATWADSALIDGIRTEVDNVRRCLVGKQGHDLIAKDIDGNRVSLYGSAGDKFTVLFFYEPSCGHCKTTTPALVEFYKKYKDDPRIRIVAFYMLTDKQEWSDFIQKNGMQDFVNVWDPDRTSFYWYWYDTSSTPQIYVLDKDNKIFVKRIDVPTLEMIAKHELKSDI